MCDLFDGQYRIEENRYALLLPHAGVHDHHSSHPERPLGVSLATGQCNLTPRSVLLHLIRIIELVHQRGIALSSPLSVLTQLFQVSFTEISRPQILLWITPATLPCWTSAVPARLLRFRLSNGSLPLEISARWGKWRASRLLSPTIWKALVTWDGISPKELSRGRVYQGTKRFK